MGLYTGYFDESGHEENKHLVVGGIAIDAKRGGEFDRDWLTAISDLPEVDGTSQLHMADFVGGYGNLYSAWKGRYPEKLIILRNAAKVIHKHANRVFVAVLDVDDMVALDAERKVSEVIGHPYAFAMRIANQMLRHWGGPHGIDPKMVIERRSGYGEVVDLFTRDQLEVPMPRTKAICALQAADYIAWMRYKQIYPTSAYEQVRDSWKEISKALYDNEYFSRVHIETVIKNLGMFRLGPIPLRSESRGVAYASNERKTRHQFRRKSKANRQP